MLPSQCAVCRSWDAGRLCRRCRERFIAQAARCPGCALPLAGPNASCGECLRQPLPFERCITALDYAWPWSHVIAALKFHDGLDLASALSALLLQALQREAPPPVDLLLPLPLGPQRLRERGYNQSWELARRVAPPLGVTADARLLLRLFDTPRQSGLARDERGINVRGAFGIAPGRASALRGRRVALLDDVMTTGATAAEAARTLLDAGATAVQLWVLARTPRPADT
ncbi:double zinc ribbon domain-containing protein [Azohydromonas caseinilytica]|uniref:double zinc ribbon domain-containing protein n=1 Tax=Azohydromonas caseinilytica TaxID=2728836 RepID=UPI001F412535|nr:double zinc ribbon domain-containing protein [Azohydromonas caseinilytica]